MEASSYETYKDDVTYSLFIIFQYTVPRGGYIRIILPKQISIEGPTNPSITYDGGSVSGTVTNDPTVKNKNSQHEIHIKLDAPVSRADDRGGKTYTIKWQGNRNPRTFMPTDLFRVWAYDGEVNVAAGQPWGNVIAEGMISNLRMKSAHNFEKLDIKPIEGKNGLITKYNIVF